MRTARLVALLAVVSVVVVFAWGQAGSQPSRITQAIDESKLSVLRGNTHPFARPEFDRGPAPANLPMERMILVLKSSPEQGAQLDQLLAEQQDRSSANYHKWLTPEEFGAQFGASDADIQQVTAWLQSHGFTIDNVAKGHNVLEFSGSAAQVQAAFRTAMHRYDINGAQHWANANDPAIPVALTPAVAGIASLNNFPRHAAHRYTGTFTRDKATGKLKRAAANPEFTYGAGCQGTAGSNCYSVAPYDFATIYNVLPLWNANITGSGQTIAIVSDSDINVADFNNFRSLFGLPAGTLNVIHNGTDPGILGGPNCTNPNGCNESEADVDTEWSGAVAPGATIDLVVSPSSNTTFGGDLSAEYIIDNKTAPIIGYSFGLCELELGTAGNLLYGGGTFQDGVSGEWKQADAEGITVVVSTGDVGSTGCENPTASSDEPALLGLAVSGIASTPYNVAVGGTDFNDAGGTSGTPDPTTYWNTTNASTTQQSAKGYIPEIAYNDSCVNISLDLSFDPSATQNAETNCNTFFATTSNLGFLVLTFGGGGGVSACTTPSGTTPSTCSGGYAKPVWQTGTGVPADGKRDLPDVSFFAGDGTFQNFYVYCEQDINSPTTSPGACSLAASASGTSVAFPDIQGIGGTSVSAEAFVGLMALVNQKVGTPVGLPNPTLYSLASLSSANCQSSGTLNSACIFYQVTSGNIAMPCAKGSPNCTVTSGSDTVGVVEANGSPAYTASAGYNLATGLGSINAYNLVNEWNLAGSTTADFLISANPTAVTIANTGGSGTTTLTITPLNGFTDTVNFSNSTSCSGLPTGATCSFSSTTVAANGTTVLTIQLPAGGAVPPSVRPDRFVQWRTPGLLALGAMLALSLVWAFRGKNREWGLAAASVIFLVFLGIAGCGGSSGSSSKGTVATPTFTPAAGTFTSTQSVTISDATSGASIFYTTNGTTPTTSSTPYSGPITVSSTETIEAIAAASGMTNSAVATAAYTIQASQVATPTFSPVAGTFSSAQSVTISDTRCGATIYFTTNGTTPTTSSTQYTGPISVGSTETIEAIAAANGATSAVATAAYTINLVPVTVTITGTSTTGHVSHSTTITLTAP